ncbi:MAG: inositol monophosphatase [Lewinellaceae bacterium]|nr:inositol monophosphatase [Lewinellaceae bacterium]
MHNLDNLEALTNAALAAVWETAEFINLERGKVQGEQIEEKLLSGLVSYVDRTAEEMLVARLGALLPDATFITEEETVANQESKLQWIIDPLDGTTNFLYNIPHFSISVALMADSELLVGIVHHVPLKESYYAWKGGGAWCNQKPIRVSQRSPLRQAVVATGFPYQNFSRVDGWMAALRSFLSEGRAMRRMGSAALDLAYVASGRFDVFFEFGLNSWDIAAGALLVKEAGGRVTDFSGGENYVFGRELLATSSEVYGEALEVIQGAF